MANGTGGGLIWGNGTGNGEDNGEGGPAGTASGSDGERGEASAQGMRGKNLGTVGRICATLPGSLRVGRCRLDSAPTHS